MRSSTAGEVPPQPLPLPLPYPLGPPLPLPLRPHGRGAGTGGILPLIQPWRAPISSTVLREHADALRQAAPGSPKSLCLSSIRLYLHGQHPSIPHLQDDEVEHVSMGRGKGRSWSERFWRH
ncbi:hypothetical protein BS78_K102100 [Paspalum vaginatum]|uniref:Uncharacterized protein n=1 Tax=Paspalum vaginatum TaxID=158149 RepID=A0A9W8CE51_9POAL|nr:hypothetical protein BS78_K102100 [Paspalum vaginatum]